MKPAARRPLSALFAILAATGCGNRSDSDDAATFAAAPAVAEYPGETMDLPEIPQRFRRNLVRAFETANDGRSPTMACTSVIARAAGNALPDGATPHPDSVRAFELCYIDVAARYIETLLARITPASPGETKDDVCARIASHAVIARTSLGSFAGNIGLDRDTLDQRLLERVKPAMDGTCPDQIEAFTGYR